MWILDDRNKSLQAKTSANYTTTPVSFSCIYATYHSDKQTPHSEYGNLESDYKDIVTGPASGTSKEIKSIRVYNSDSIAHTITFILKTINSTQESEITIYKTTLSASWTIEYIKEKGWNTYNNQGQPVVIQTTSLAASLNDSYIFVGDATNVAVGVPVTGDLSLVNTGAFTVDAIQGFTVTMGGTLTTTGNITMVGAFNYTFNITGNTNVTFPTSGTLATLAGAETFTNKISYNGLIITPNTGVVTTGIWNGTIVDLAYGGTNADLSATGGSGQILKQDTLGGNITVGLISASSISGGAILSKVDDTNVTLTLGGNPTVALLAATSLTLGWTGTLADGRIASAATWNAKEPAITGGTTLQYWRGDKSFQTLDTSVVPENGNIYFTTGRVDTRVAAYTGDVTLSGTVFTIGAGKVTNAMLVNSAVTIGSTSVSLGATVTTFVGLTSVTSTTFVGALTGNSSTATALQTPRLINGVSFDGTTDINTTNYGLLYAISRGQFTI